MDKNTAWKYYDRHRTADIVANSIWRSKFNGDDCGSSVERNGISSGSSNQCDRISAWSCAWRGGQRRDVWADALPKRGMGAGFDRFSKQRRGYSRFRHGCEGICGRRGIFGSSLYAALHWDHISQIRKYNDGAFHVRNFSRFLLHGSQRSGTASAKTACRCLYHQLCVVDDLFRLRDAGTRHTRAENTPLLKPHTKRRYHYGTAHRK